MAFLGRGGKKKQNTENQSQQALPRESWEGACVQPGVAERGSGTCTRIPRELGGLGRTGAIPTHYTSRSRWDRAVILFPFPGPSHALLRCRPGFCSSAALPCCHPTAAFPSADSPHPLGASPSSRECPLSSLLVLWVWDVLLSLHRVEIVAGFSFHPLDRHLPTLGNISPCCH